MCLGRGNVDLNVRSRQTFASRSEDRKWPRVDFARSRPVVDAGRSRMPTLKPVEGAVEFAGAYGNKPRNRPV